MPFSREEFLDVFRRYNETVWPTQLALLMLGIATLLLASLHNRRASAAASIGLATLWLWTALAYHLAFFKAINPIATVFAAAFIVQAVLLLVQGLRSPRLELRLRPDAVTVTAVGIAVYALIGYPLLGYLLGHRYPSAPTFGAPCPTTILTFALLLLAKPPVPRVLLIVPGLWALVGTVGAITLGMHEDLGLTIAAIVTLAITIGRGRRATHHPTPAVATVRPNASSCPMTARTPSATAARLVSSGPRGAAVLEGDLLAVRAIEPRSPSDTDTGATTPGKESRFGGSTWQRSDTSPAMKHVARETSSA